MFIDTKVSDNSKKIGELQKKISEMESSIRTVKKDNLELREILFIQ